MTSRDTLRRAADAGRRAAASLGGATPAVRDVRVYLRTQTYGAALGRSDDGNPTNADVEILPTPRVVRLSEQQASYYGADLGPIGGGQVEVYDVGPITAPFDAGGAALSTLVASATTSVRPLVVLTGDRIPSGTAVCQVVRSSKAGVTGLGLIVRRTSADPSP